MIKLIATDLDGTLLPPTKQLPEETFSLIERLYAKGIIFAPASGRQLPNLLKLFEPVKDKIAVIAENGGLCLFKGKIIHSDPTPKEQVLYALDKIAGCEGLYPLLSGEKCAFYESGYEPFTTVAKRSYSSIQKVKDIKKAAEENEIYKISVWDGFPPSAGHGGPLLTPEIKGLRVMVSGYDWLDVSVSHANKGRALEALMRAAGVEKQECAAFGDHMNDMEMLIASGKPFITANAFAGLKSAGFEEVASNAELGVIKKIKEWL